jgi:hypothetical protein
MTDTASKSPLRCKGEAVRGKPPSYVRYTTAGMVAAFGQCQGSGQEFLRKKRRPLPDERGGTPPARDRGSRTQPLSERLKIYWGSGKGGPGLSES